MTSKDKIRSNPSIETIVKTNKTVGLRNLMARKRKKMRESSIDEQLSTISMSSKTRILSKITTRKKVQKTDSNDPLAVIANVTPKTVAFSERLKCKSGKKTCINKTLKSITREPKAEMIKGGVASKSLMNVMALCSDGPTIRISSPTKIRNILKALDARATTGDTIKPTNENIRTVKQLLALRKKNGVV